MPWTPAQAKGHNSKLTDAQAKEWSKIANAILKSSLADGMDQDAAEAKAIKIANSKFEESLDESDDDDGILTTGEILDEYSDFPSSPRIDEEKGIVYDVKLVGLTSKKGRRYPPQLLAREASKYNNTPINLNHVDPGQRRDIDNRFGVVKNPILKADGLYGEAHYLKTHPFAPRFLEAARRIPGAMGFSHDTRGSSRNINGIAVVESIDKILSCDLVANPATTGGIFEDIQESLDSLLSGTLQEEGCDDYAYCPDKDDPSTWKLPIHDAKHAGMAAAALSSGGFRGKQVDIPDSAKAGVKAKVRAAWKKFNPEKGDDEMPESIKESLEEDDSALQEAWSPASRASAARARFAKKNSANMELTAKIKHANDVSDAADRASTQAYKSNTTADHQKAMDLHASAENLQNEVGNKGAADRHSGMVHEHGDAMSDAVDAPSSDPSDHDQQDDFQEDWTPAARAAAAAKRHAQAQAASERAEASEAAADKGGAKEKKATVALHLKAAKAHHSAALGYNAANAEILKQYEVDSESPGTTAISSRDTEALVNNSAMARQHFQEMGKHYAKINSYSGKNSGATGADDAEGAQEDFSEDEMEVFQEAWSEAARVAAAASKKAHAAIKASDESAMPAAHNDAVKASLEAATAHLAAAKADKGHMSSVAAHKASAAAFKASAKAGPGASAKANAKASRLHGEAATAWDEAGDTDQGDAHRERAKWHDNQAEAAMREGFDESDEDFQEDDDTLQEEWSEAARAAALASRKAKAASNPAYAAAAAAASKASAKAGRTKAPAAMRKAHGDAMVAHHKAEDAARSAGDEDQAKLHQKAKEEHGYSMLEAAEKDDKGKDDKAEGAQESLEGEDSTMSEETLAPRLMEELKTLRAEKVTRELRESIDRELDAAGLHRDNAMECSEVFMEEITACVDPIRRKMKIRDRAEVIAEAAAGTLHRSTRAAPAPRTQHVTAYSSSPLQEYGDGSETASIPPASAPLQQRLARFVGR